LAAGLLLLSYPLHPPGKPDAPRTAHFPNLETQALFVHGTKDPFGTPEEMRAALKLISGPTELALVENAGHDLRRGQFDMKRQIVDPLTRVVECD
jgi:predicted alpha/beta-hydrolase family hydrolase